MPAYNASRFVGQAINSILTQSFRELELIVIDDGSTDNTLEIVKHYAEQDKRIRVISKEHGGISDALNTGINNSKYSWIGIMHADDIALSHRLARQVKEVRANPSVVVWGTFAYHINSRNEILSISRVGPTTEEEFCHLRRKGQIVLVIHTTALLNKKVVLKVGGYDTVFNGSEELELFDRMAEYGPILSVPEPLALYRIHSSSVSMHRFFQMRRFTRYVRARGQSRLRGVELNFDEFIEAYRQQPLMSRLRKKLDDLSQYSYRKAALFFGEKEYLKAGLNFVLSTTLNPIYAVPRIWHQMLSTDAQRWLNEPKGSGRNDRNL
jgi:glycosyltransferase involved in cell wall biosynthesis